VFKFRHITSDDLSMIMAWRASEHVNRVMLTDVRVDMVKQRQWFESIQNDTQNRYWVIEYNQQPIGVINQSEVCQKHLRCSWGFYIGEQEWIHLGGLIPPYFYNYVFKNSTLQKITAQVLSNNTSIMKLHSLHGYRHIEVYESHINKGDQWLDLHSFELHKKTWINKKRFSSFNADFD